MTGLRKAAQDVIDSVDSPYIPDDVRMVDAECINALRQALQAEPEKPVAWLLDTMTTHRNKKKEVVFSFGDIEKLYKGRYIRAVTPLYTAPPSVDALIAEAMREYVPMTDDERWNIFMFGTGDQINESLAEIEAEVIKRAGLRIKGRDNG